MKLLLDTQIAFWFVAERSRMSAAEIAVIRAAPELVISAVSIWEMRLKWHRLHPSGARKGPIDPVDLLDAIVNGPYVVLPLTATHAVTTLAEPLAHSDPFDELLLVQAQVEGLRLLTRHRALAGHPLVVTGAG